MATVAGLVVVGTSMMPASAADADTLAVTGTMSATVRLLGGGGTFGFVSTGPLGCVDATNVGGVAASSCTLSASGTFTNILCGMGTAVGTATLSTTRSVGFSFGVTAVAGVAVIDDNLVSGTPTVTGVAVLTPNSPQTDGVTCTMGFNVVAALSLVD